MFLFALDKTNIAIPEFKTDKNKLLGKEGLNPSFPTQIMYPYSTFARYSSWVGERRSIPTCIEASLISATARSISAGTA